MNNMLENIFKSIFSPEKVFCIIVITVIIFPVQAISAGSAGRCIKEIEKSRVKLSLKDADKISEKCLRKFPDNKKILFLRGLILYDRTRFSKSYMMFEKIIASGKGDDETYFWLLRSDLSKKRAFSHEKVLSLIKKRFRKNSVKLAKAGKIIVEFRDYDAAIDYYESLTRGKYPEKWFYHLKAGQLHGKNNNWRKAEKHFAASYRKNSKNGIALYYLGQSWEEREDYNKAVSFYSLSLKKGLSSELSRKSRKKIDQLSRYLKK